MIVRNIFFHENKVKNNVGQEIVYYTGNIFTNAKNIKNINTLYDKSKDLYIVCGTCAAKKYKNFIKKYN